MTVYVVRRGATGPVKIGVTRDLPGRLSALKTANTEPLHLLRHMPGTRITERWMHSRFADLHLMGEWFTFSDEMLAVVPPPEPETSIPPALIYDEDVEAAPITEEFVRDAVSRALKRAVGAEPDAALKVARLVGCDQRTALTWLNGTSSPMLAMAMRLMACFPEVQAELMPHVLFPHLRRIERAMLALELAKENLRAQLRSYVDPLQRDWSAALADNDMAR